MGGVRKLGEGRGGNGKEGEATSKNVRYDMWCGVSDNWAGDI